VLPKLIATEQLYKYFKFYFHQQFSCVYLKRKYQFERNCSCHAITLSRDATLRDGDPSLLFHTPLRHFLILFNYYNIDMGIYFLCLRFLRVNFFFSGNYKPERIRRLHISFIKSLIHYLYFYSMKNK